MFVSSQDPLSVGRKVEFVHKGLAQPGAPFSRGYTTPSTSRVLHPSAGLRVSLLSLCNNNLKGHAGKRAVGRFLVHRQKTFYDIKFYDIVMVAVARQGPRRQQCRVARRI